MQWFKQFTNSIAGVFVWFVLLLGAIWLIFWNEGRSVQRHKALNEGKNTVVSYETIEQIDPNNEGTLLHINGSLNTQAGISDPLLQQQFSGYVKATRNVEQYQRQENKQEIQTTRDDKTTTEIRYSYAKIRSDTDINSQSFFEPGHDNLWMMFEQEVFYAVDTTLWAFFLSETILNKLNSFQTILLNNERYESLPDDMFYRTLLQTNMFYIGLDEQPTISKPVIGDHRISYEWVRAWPVTIIGQQENGHIVPYISNNGQSILLVEEGTHSVSQMFDNAQAANTQTTWFLRIAGLVMMFIARSMLFGPIKKIVWIIPILGDIVNFGINGVAFLLTLVIGLIDMGIARLFYRPLWGVLLIAAWVGVVFGYKKFLKGDDKRQAKKKQAKKK